ncbi:MAG: GNAT family N-acetyltransferase, partial [Acidimicrobiales bacterium]
MPSPAPAGGDRLVCMDVEVRKLGSGEQEDFVRSVRVPFLAPVTGDPEDGEDVRRGAAKRETDRAWVAVDGGRFVANACVYSMDVTVPGAPGEPAPLARMAGVSAVGVHPTHRRRGLLRRLMAEMLDDARERGEPLAGLIASESVIYGRFGFGHATDMTELTIDSRASRFDVPAPRVAIRLVDRDEAAKILPDLYDRQRRGRAGEPNRSEHVWEGVIADRPDRRRGGSGVFFAVCDEGYVAYRAHDGVDKRSELARVVIEELRGLTPEVESALWRFVLDLDLVGEVNARRRPVDEPLRWRLADPRQLRVADVYDRLHLRLLDVPAALEARRYLREGRLVLDVLPPAVDEGARDPAPGTWVLEAGPDGASCRQARAGDAPDLRLGVGDLGSVYLGGFPASLLAAAGRVEELTPGSLTVADALFAARPAPMTGTGF